MPERSSSNVNEFPKVLRTCRLKPSARPRSCNFRSNSCFGDMLHRVARSSKAGSLNTVMAFCMSRISASESRKASVDSAPWFPLTRSTCNASRQPPVLGSTVPARDRSSRGTSRRRVGPAHTTRDRTWRGRLRGKPTPWPAPRWAAGRSSRACRRADKIRCCQWAGSGRSPRFAPPPASATPAGLVQTPAVVPWRVR